MPGEAFRIRVAETPTLGRPPTPVEQTEELLGW